MKEELSVQVENEPKMTPEENELQENMEQKEEKKGEVYGV